MGDAAEHPDRVEKLIALVFVLAMVCFGLAAPPTGRTGTPGSSAAALGAGLFFLGFGLTAWGKYLMPQGPFVEERHVLASSPEERDSMSAALVERSAVVVKRRKLLGGLFAAGAGIFGIVAAFPLLRSLGPLPKDELDVTQWKAGSVLVDSSGRPVTRDTLVVGGIMTVFPAAECARERQVTSRSRLATDQTVLIRVPDEPFVTARAARAGRPTATWPTPSSAPTWAARSASTSRSSSCWSARATSRCSTSATAPCPQFGPAPRPLPQLPLGYNDDGYLIAMAPYDQPVGPGFWERTT